MENTKVNTLRLFYGSCFALITTAFSYSIRAGILPQLQEEFGLTAAQLGTINSMWFYGFPIAMIVGGLGMEIGWKPQIWIIVIPTVIYAYLFFGQKFPKPSVQEAKSLKGNLKGMASPVFIFIAVCMALTAISEFVPGQWVRLILDKSGADSMVILALMTGVMAVGRYFGGNFVNKFDQTGVLLGSAIIATLGMFLLSTQTGIMAYVAAAVFGMGLCYFWPNMIGFVAEKIPKSGALGMSVIGAIGMFMTANMQPIFGGWIDDARSRATSMGLTGDALELAAGQETLKTMIAFPAVLIVLFAILYFWMKNRKKNKTVAATA